MVEFNSQSENGNWEKRNRNESGVGKKCEARFVNKWNGT